MQVGFAGEGGLRASGHRDQRVALSLEHRQQHRDFVGFAGIGQRQHHVAVGDHAQIAVAGLAGMDIERGRAGGGEGRGDLARDVAGFAHAHADHAAGAGQNGAAGLGELPIDAACDGGQAVALDLEHPSAAGGEGVVGESARGRDGVGL